MGLVTSCAVPVLGPPLKAGRCPGSCPCSGAVALLLLASMPPAPPGAVVPGPTEGTVTALSGAVIQSQAGPNLRWLAGGGRLLARCRPMAGGRRSMRPSSCRGRGRRGLPNMPAAGCAGNAGARRRPARPPGLARSGPGPCAVAAAPGAAVASWHDAPSPRGARQRSAWGARPLVVPGTWGARVGRGRGDLPEPAGGPGP